MGFDWYHDYCIVVGIDPFPNPRFCDFWRALDAIYFKVTRERHCAHLPASPAIGATTVPRLFRPRRAPAPSPDVPAYLSFVAIDSLDRRAAAVRLSVRRAW